MKKLIPLFLFMILVFITCQNASAFTLSAVPQKQNFTANDWIKINLAIDGYDGGNINWVAHRPDNSVLSGAVDSQLKFGKTVHQIIRDASDNEFGPWSINYQYRGINQTVHFDVIPLNLAVFMDKVTYYEPNIMNINITSSYYNPEAKYAKYYYLNFYDRDGNLAVGSQEIQVLADRPSVLYHFPMFELSNYNPPGLYKLKVQYFNSFIEVPFLLGDIHKLMEISAQTSATYYQGSDVTIDIILTRLTQSTATLKITDPLGNTTSNQFHPRSIHDTLVLKNFSKKIGTYKYEVHYAGTTTTGSFNVIKNIHELPNIKLEILPNKLNYRPGEIANFEIHTSEVITNSISTWVTNPDGKTSPEISLPLDTTEIIIPHKIAKNDSNGQWNLYVNYDGIVISSSFYVGGPPVEDSEVLDAVQYSVPTFVSVINSTTFKSPTGITVDSDNSTYVIDSGNSKVKKFDESGNLLLFWGDTSLSMGQFKNPLGIFVNEKYVYVVDTGNTRINMFDKTGNFVYSWGTYGDNHGMFQMPVSINSNHNDELFVADAEKNSIQLFDTKGNYREQIDSSLTEGASFSGIRALAFDSQDNLFAVSTDNKILKYSNIEKFLNFYGSSGTEEGRFNNPSAIAIDSKNNIYVADTDNHRIQKFDVNGNFLLSWGTEGTGQGQFEQPVGLAIDALDNIYVVDKKNNNIQKFALYGGMDKNVLPSWVRNTAIWWSEGALDKKDLSQAIRYMINQGLIKTPSINQNDNVQIPNWLKGNVEKWSSGQIDDNTFWASIQHLISIGIMKV
ncbi:MAG: 6-bladed beta-propeller [Candidatus Nitrosotalea sp.]|nr:6-bladed beta-propeller [Candidatus Nitrosotalea sp.]